VGLPAVEYSGELAVGDPGSGLKQEVWLICVKSRLLKINQLSWAPREAVETAREPLIIGPPERQCQLPPLKPYCLPMEFTDPCCAGSANNWHGSGIDKWRHLSRRPPR
jgi:hypothetical protein